MQTSLRVILVMASLLTVAVAVVFIIVFQRHLAVTEFGATYSPTYAEHLGLDARVTYTQMLSDFDFTNVRIPVHWDIVQPEPEVSEFTELDWYLDQAAERNVGVVLAIGNKVPRWPECYTPGWVQELDAEGYKRALLSYIETMVMRYDDHPALVRWQVENEAFFRFGHCPKPDVDLLTDEMALIRSLDPTHPIQLTVSGEQQWWAAVSHDADVVGASLYRMVGLPDKTIFTFPIPPRWYTLQSLLTAFFADDIVVSELQAEPWLNDDYRTYTPEAAAALFTPDRLRGHLQYARSTGIREISVWGVEWWYYLKQHGQPELWETAREIITAP